LVSPDDGGEIMLVIRTRAIAEGRLSIDIWTVNAVKEPLNSLELSVAVLGLFTGDDLFRRANSRGQTIRIFCVSETVAVIIDSVITYFGLPLPWCARLYPLHTLA